MKTRKIQSLVILCMLTFCAYSIGANAKTDDTFTIPGEYILSTQIQSAGIEDFDPLCDVEVTFELKAIRSLERTDHHLNVEKK